jgi:hypothetical protein
VVFNRDNFTLIFYFPTHRSPIRHMLSHLMSVCVFVKYTNGHLGPLKLYSTNTSANETNAVGIWWNVNEDLKWIRAFIQKFPNWVHNKIYAYNNKHSLRSNTKDYGDKTR